MKKPFSFFLLFCFSLSMIGQNTFNKLVYFDYPTTTFTSVYPTDSCYYVAGTFVDTVSPLRTGAMFAKIDLDGELSFTKIIKHPDRLYNSYFTDFIQTPDGNLLHAGQVGDTITYVILYKYTPQGDTILTKEYISVLYPELWYLYSREVRVKPDGGYAILIGHESTFNVDFDISLLVLDSTYNILHYKAFGTNLQETAGSLLLDDDGGYIIGADRTNTNLTNTNFTSRTYIIKTDSTGEVQWEYLSPAGVLQDRAKAMIKTPDGGLVVASGKGVEDPVHPSIHFINWDALVFKLDAERNLVWSTPLRGIFPTPLTELNEMVASVDGSGYVAVGKVAEAVSGPEPMSGSWIVKVSPEGDSLWVRYYTVFDGVDLDPQPFDLKQTVDGGYVVVGHISKLGQPAPGWIMKVDSLGCLVPGCYTATEEPTGGEPAISLAIYPNPTTDYLNFYLRSPHPLKKAIFRIVNAEGKLMKTFESNQTDATFIVPVWDWPVGVYILQYMEEGVVRAWEKFIKK